jgi:hypothetical protein
MASNSSRWWSLLIGLALALLGLPAHGLPPPTDSDDDPRHPLLTRQDTVPHELFHEEQRGAPFWVAIDASIGQTRDGSSAFGAMLLLGLPLERLRGHVPLGPRLTEDARGEGRKAKAPPDPSRGWAPAPASPAPLSAELPLSPRAESAKPPAGAPLAPSPTERVFRSPSELPVNPAVARAAVQAALQRARLLDPDARIDALASRARSSALLPELRVRASRTVDEGQTLSPTEYDPARTTASGGVSLWLEARATWRLDRLLFADEEVALERIRSQRAEDQAKLTERVLGLLFTWQRALVRASDEAASPEEQLAATLKKIEVEVELDILTDGWFTRWRATGTRVNPARG